MSQKPYVPAPAADFVLPFDLPEVGLRGRLVRLDLTSSRALSAHALPEPAVRVAGETLALAATRAALSGRACALNARVAEASSRTRRPRKPTSGRSNGKTKSAAGACL